MCPSESKEPLGSNSHASALRKTVFLILRLAIGVGILVYLAKSGQINFSSLIRLIHVWPITVIATGILLLDIVIMSIRASLLFHNTSLSLSLGNSIRLNLIGFLFSTFLPGAAGGDIAKVVYATRENRGRRAEVATILILDRMVGLFSLVLLPLLFAPFFRELLSSVATLRWIVVADGALAGLMLAGTALITLFAPTRSWVGGLLQRWPGIQSIALRVLDALALHGRARGTMCFAVFLSVLANLALIAVTGLGLYAVSPGSLSMRLTLVAPIGHLVNSLPLTPGGIGVGETAFNALFAMTGMSGGAEALLCVRLWNVIIGMLGLLVYVGGLGRIVHPHEEKQEDAGPEYIGTKSAN
jgi:uncharacterized membrane protein YbhN (UPF0104 family)